MSASVNQCKQCYVGRYRESDMPYLCWIDDREVVVPDVPGFQCDICGDSYHNPEFIQLLHRLIDRGAVSDKHDLSTHRQVSTGGKEGSQPIGRSAKS